jgi:Protein of unknown function (DUF1566)
MKKTILSFALFSLPSVLTFGQNVVKTMLRLPDTGQTSNFTASQGEDADYNIFTPYFLFNGNGSVTDTVTGLMWQQTDGGEMTIENALNYCDTLTLGGHSDWRLPNAHEAFSILNHNYSNPALNLTVFAPTNAEYWWTSSRQANDNTKIWVTNAGGGIGNHQKLETISAGGTKRFNVRAVRDIYAPTAAIPHFIDHVNNTITDQLTGLVWQKVPLTDTLTWEQSLQYAENLSLAGKSDWRLPNIKELQSLNDENLVNPSINTLFFSTIGLKKYWSSTSLPNQTVQAWYLDTRFGITTHDVKTKSINLLCVRGPETGNIVGSTAPKQPTSGGVFPNPFSSHIYLEHNTEGAYFELLNTSGTLFFAGNDLHNQDFTNIPAGIYWLKIFDAQPRTILLIKE